MEPLEQLLERVLVLRCQTGDRAAVEELFRRYHRRVGYYLRRMLDDAEAAADVQQEVWLSVVRRVGGLKSPEAFAVWLYAIARNKAMNHLAARGRPDRSGAGPPPDQLADELGEDVDEPFSPADAARVHQALGRLGPEHREVLTLRFMEEMNYEQIAEVVGCGVGTVRSRLHYAKRALRKELEEAHE